MWSSRLYLPISVKSTACHLNQETRCLPWRSFPSPIPNIWGVWVLFHTPEWVPPFFPTHCSSSQAHPLTDLLASKVIPIVCILHWAFRVQAEGSHFSPQPQATVFFKHILIIQSKRFHWDISIHAYNVVWPYSVPLSHFLISPFPTPSLLKLSLKMQSKTTLRFHLTPVGMAISKGNNNKCWWGCSKTEALICCWWECKLVQPLWKAIWRCLKKLETELPYDPVIPLLASIQKNVKQDTIQTPVHRCSLQHYSQ
jgi:hypothetical protein